MRCRINYLAAALGVALLAVTAFGIEPAQAMDECGLGDKVCGEGGPDHSGIGVRLSGSGVGVTGGDDGCVYSTGQPGLPITGTGEEGSRFILEGIVSVFVQWDCDDDGVADQPGVFVELVDLEALALAALDDVPWPELEIEVPFEEKYVVSGFSTPMLLVDGDGTTFETEFEASAEENGVEVTAIGTAQIVNWNMGSINADLGHEGDEFECDTFGEPEWNTETYTNPCFMIWRGSSAGQPGDRVTLTAEVVYDIVYETNLFAGQFLAGDPEFALDFERPDFPVSEIHVVNTSG